jgi:hypothetical protein
MYVHVQWSPRAWHCRSLSIDLPIQLWVTMNHSGSTHTKTIMCTGSKEDDTTPADERLFWDLQELDRVYHYHQPKTANSMSDQVCISNITLQKPTTTRAVSPGTYRVRNSSNKMQKIWHLDLKFTASNTNSSLSLFGSTIITMYSYKTCMVYST